MGERLYDPLVVPVPGSDLTRDEGIRPDASLQALSARSRSGHPLGASGGPILGTLAAVLHERGERWGAAAICIGVGQGLAVVLENVR